MKKFSERCDFRKKLHFLAKYPKPDTFLPVLGENFLTPIQPLARPQAVA
jgi:hypothetical protein